jgi:hypothetical protein
MSSYFQQLMKNEDYRAKIYLIAWIASICATASLVIGGIMIVVLALRYSGLF